VLDDPTTLYRAVSGRDRRFDGRFVFGVTSTGIYCRPSCPARTPRAENCVYFAVPAAAAAGGFRPCKRCRPDAVPGSREWDHRGDLAARALRLIADGAVDEAGVAGVAAQLNVSERHLHRTLVSEVGVAPQRLALTRRAQVARLLLEQTQLPVTQVAYAAGFASIRQFNDVIREQFASTPRDLRHHVSQPDRPARPGLLTLRLATREPFAWRPLFGFLAARAIAGVESAHGDELSRSIPTSRGPALVTVAPGSGRLGAVTAHLQLPDLAVLTGVVSTLRRWLDLDADPAAVDDALGGDRLLAPLVAARPGLRVPGTVDGFELAMRAVIGQQVSVAAAATFLSRLTELLGAPAPVAVPGAEAVGVTKVFPTAEQVAAAGPQAGSQIGLTGVRAVTVHRLAQDVASGAVVLDPGAPHGATRAALLAIPGVGPWTADYIAMRALADPDAWPGSDLVLRRVVGSHHADPELWRPWRSYAAVHLWSMTAEEAR
jgi:AraC family transcriptional regulator, regulatory protein of adaptative response / DNA-3-methyladenine glycosylase II